MLPDNRILESVLARQDDLDRACRTLIDEANAEGGRDNASVILIARRS
jgi:serine/threonine protein phosphatase PrpC